ncbi:MAG: hypothetical protein HY302_15340 [Opitutae bacterium]|nr:hypothetical protein [Opitutae bacterium]
MTFSEFYHELQKREGHEPQTLIDAWPASLAKEIAEDFLQGVNSQPLKGSVCPIRPGSSNQSIGNQVEAFVVPRLAAGLPNFRLEKCTGAGYPDQQLSRDDLLIPLELKATGDWNPNDSNRRVLTSSSEKLRKYFRPPIYHLLCTVLYTAEKGGTRIDAIRLDFLEPDSPVSVRLEVSVNHKLLATGKHKSVTI